MSHRKMWAIVRIDHFLDDLPTDSMENREPERLVTVTGVYADPTLAAREVDRLSGLRDPAEIEYFSRELDVCSEPVGQGAVALIRLEGYRPGTRVAPRHVRLGGVWQSLDAAAEHLQQDPHPGFGWRIQRARLKPRALVTR